MVRPLVCETSEFAVDRVAIMYHYQSSQMPQYTTKLPNAFKAARAIAIADERVGGVKAMSFR